MPTGSAQRSTGAAADRPRPVTSERHGAAGERETRMSDRTPSSVRTGAAPADRAAATAAAPARSPRPPVSRLRPASLRPQLPIPGGHASPPRPGAAGAGAPPRRPPARAGAAPTVGSLPGRRRSVDRPDDGRPQGRPRKAAARPCARPREGGRGPRRARLQLRHIDTWSALKISLVLSIALFFIWMVAVGVLYGVLNAPRRLRHPQRALRPARQRVRRRGDRRRHHPGRRLRRRGDHRRDQHRAAHRAVHRGHVHLQPLLRPGRRPRDHALRAGLSDGHPRRRPRITAR